VSDRRNVLPFPALPLGDSDLVVSVDLNTLAEDVVEAAKEELDASKANPDRSDTSVKPMPGSRGRNETA
jgi:hypothetical protein